MQNSQTQCHCTSEACAKAEGYQRHPCGRCVKEGAVYMHARAPELWLCNACADYWDANDIHSKTRWTLERLTGLARRAGIIEKELKPDVSRADLESIIAEDKRDRWPAIEAMRSK